MSNEWEHAPRKSFFDRYCCGDQPSQNSVPFRFPTSRRGHRFTLIEVDIPVWLQWLAVISLAGGFVSAAAIVFDLIRQPQHMWIMNVVWPITALYLGPLALWSYWRIGRAVPQHGKRAFWQVVIIEATHCGAGCTLGDVIAEFAILFGAISIASSKLLTDYAGDFILAYVFGIAFQYFAIAPMRGLSFLPGLWAAIQADTLSLTAFEVGLFAWMAVMTLLPFHAALSPVQPAYWFLMQIGMTIGFVTSYPANWFLVVKGIKEPM
jgi:hypothetical protein